MRFSLLQPNATLADGQLEQGNFSVCVWQQHNPKIALRSFFFLKSKSFSCACLAELGVEKRKSSSAVDTIKSPFGVFIVSLDDESEHHQ